ncbi:MAG: efflux RND transporter periplasmic adaptor subunit [Candidatus Riflebacteria bacterium]|nr:efflux RND transporter periplasmic adaptor subunit [Candidatus Riflebacteria bacterium]
MKKYIMLVVIIVSGIVFMITSRLSAIKNTPKVQNVNNFQARSGIPVQVVRPVNKDMKTELELLGTVRAYREINVSARLCEEIISTELKLGRICKKDEILVQLFDSEIIAQMKLAESSLEQAKANLDKMLAGARPQERKEIEAALNAAEAEYENARKELDRMDSLRKKDAIPEQKADRAAASYQGAKSAFEAAKQRLSTVREGTRQEDIRVGKAQLQQASANLELMKIRFEHTKLKSPVDGVISGIFKELGELADKDKPVFSVIETSQVYIEADVPFNFINHIKLGQKARLVDENHEYPEAVYGVITEIKPVSDSFTRTFPVKILFQNPDSKLMPGMFKTVSIVYAEKSSASVLPKDCLLSRGDKKGIFVVEDKKALFREVSLGLSGNDEIEILSGITEKDKVVLKGQNNLISGTLVDCIERN